MPNTRSAKKSLRQAAKRRVVNLRRLRAMKGAVKQVHKASADKKKDDAVELLPAAYKAIDKAAKRGIIKANTASRKKSRLTKLVQRG